MEGKVGAARINWATLAKMLSTKAGMNIPPAKLEIWLEDNATPIAEDYVQQLLEAAHAETEKVTALYYKENAYAGEQFRRAEAEAGKVEILAKALRYIANSEGVEYVHPKITELAQAALKKAGLL